MKQSEEMKEFKGTKGEWTINHWERGGSGVTYKGETNGIAHCTGDNVYREEYRIVSELHPNSHSIEHSFEGAHIAEIAARSEESLANAQLIAAAPDLLEALMIINGDIERAPNPYTSQEKMEIVKKAINKALGL